MREWGYADIAAGAFGAAFAAAFVLARRRGLLVAATATIAVPLLHLFVV